ncbi:MAG: HAD-superfamily hydrolase-like protein [Alphaproteobacteria bacterium]|nr:MAG: HAD-superfamily hydrolase-like protein [Caulobacteraceae bacterium]TPW06362.1 MAG: HAD-superfamily hydrolase-like protein [Alphaproteobacteria bacterium]
MRGRMTAFPESLESLADRYDAVLCDIWGVLHNGREVFPEAVDALLRYREMGGIVVLVSNVPKPRDPIPGQLDRLGCPPGVYDAIVTSGDAIRAELRERAPGPMLKIGPIDDDVLWQGLGLEQVDDVQDAAFLAISGLDEPFGEKPFDYSDLLEDARERDLELLCANPDLVVRVGERMMWCAGTVAAQYEKLGGRVVMAGKPFAPIYRLAFEEIENLAGRAIDERRLLAIGDGVGTDIRGANVAGIDALFIASGMHGEALRTNGVLDSAKVTAALAAEDARADYAMGFLQ